MDYSPWFHWKSSLGLTGWEERLFSFLGTIITLPNYLCIFLVLIFAFVWMKVCDFYVDIQKLIMARYPWQGIQRRIWYFSQGWSSVVFLCFLNICGQNVKFKWLCLILRWCFEKEFLPFWLFIFPLVLTAFQFGGSPSAEVAVFYWLATCLEALPPGPPGPLPSTKEMIHLRGIPFPVQCG